MNIENTNKEYYNRHYSHKTTWLGLIHSLISFDQQSKSKRNFQIIRPILAKMESGGKSSPVVLDYGFGHGSFLLKVPRNCKIFGFDLSQEAVHSLKAVTRNRIPPLHLHTSDQFQRETENVKFDLIVCSHILEHVPDDGEIMRLFANHLAPGGKILINLPVNEVWPDPLHIRGYTADSAGRLMSQADLKIESTFQCDRWTAFLLTHEHVQPAGKPIRLVLRVLRLLFAIIPLKFLDAIEDFLPGRFKDQQLLVLASKP